MEDENIFFDDIEESLDEKERAKVKNKRKNYTILEIQTILIHYEKSGHLRDTAKFFDVPPSTLAGWIKKKDDTYLLIEKKLIIDLSLEEGNLIHMNMMTFY